MPIEFLPAQPEDAHTLSILRQQVWATTYRGIYLDNMIDAFDFPFHDKRNLLYITHPEFLTYFIVENSEKIGYLILRKSEPLRLNSLYLLEPSRGRGIGAAAFDFVRGYCREHGRKNFLLDCHPDNAPALAFYAKMGGAVTGRDTGHENNEENSLTLEFTV